MSTYQPYPKYKDSGVEWLGNVPEGWEVSKLKHAVDPGRPITYGIVQAGPDIPGGIPYVRPADMGDECGVIDPEGIMRTSPEIAASYTRSAIKPGDLVCSIGPSFGKVMTVPKWLEGGNLTQGTARVAVSKHAHAKFFFWVLLSEESYGQWESSIGGATFRALNLGPLAETATALPPLPEQIQIASFLDRECGKLDALQAKQERLIELLKEKRQALISHAVTKGLDSNAKLKPSGIEWLGDVPEGWVVCRLKHISPQITVGIVVEPSKYYAETGVPALRSLNIRPRTIVEENFVFISEKSNAILSKSKLSAGDLVTVRTGQPGTTAVIPENLHGCNCIDLIVIRKPKADCEQFLAWWFSSDSAVQQFSEGSGGAIQQHFNVAMAVNLIIPLPPLAEQRAIVAHLDEKCGKIDRLMAKAEHAIELLKERRSALISAAVTGKIDVRQS